MNARTQQEADAVIDADLDVDAAGFTARPLYKREQASAGDTPDINELLARASEDPLRKSLAADLHGSPAVEPQLAGFGPAATGPVEPTLGPDFVYDLREHLAAAWGQTAIDDSAFEAVKNFVVVDPADGTQPLVIADPASDDEVMVGTRADGAQSVLGRSGITAAQALSRAQLAMTSDIMRTEGVEEVHGTEMDKALLLLAAEKVGLTIANKPEISAEVMQEAREQWARLMHDMEAKRVFENALAVGATATEAHDIAAQLTPDLDAGPVINRNPATEIDENTFAAAAAPAVDKDGFPDTVIEEPAFADTVFEERPVVAAVEPIPAPEAIEIEAAEIVEPQAVQVEAVEVAEARHVEIPVLTDVIDKSTLLEPTTAEEAAYLAEVQASRLKPEVKAVLAGNSPNEAVNPEVYVDLVSGIKAGNEKFADKEGFINVRGITEEFQARGIGTGKARRLVEALKADHLVYETGQSAPAVRTVVNYQVSSPVMKPPRIMPQ